MGEGYHWVPCVANLDLKVKNYRDVRPIGWFGSYGRKAGQLLDPLGITVFDGRLYLTDPMLNAVCVYNCNKELISSKQYVPTQQQFFPSVFDVTVHKPSGTILVSDPVKKCVHTYNKDGESSNALFDKTIEITKAESIAGVCVTKSGRLVVADSEDGMLYVCDGKGQILTTIGEKGDNEGQLCMPQFLCYDELNERLLVSDTANSRVQAFDLEGNFLFTFGSHGTENGQFKYPSGLDVDDHGRILVVDQGLHNVQVFDRNGEWLHTLGGPGIKLGNFHSPKDLTILDSGDIYVTDSLNCRIQYFS